tara:strand:+ start:915 stop:1457 length:543 start_codon:yes stop_codon:yes gene_type:complete
MIKFLISTLAAAGLLDTPENIDGNNKSEEKTKTIENAFFNYFNYDLGYTLAAHSSHASHGSHGSHGSHQSHSNSGHSSHQSHQSSSQPSSPTVPKGGNNATPPKSILPETPQKLKGSMGEFKIKTLQVQAVLYAYGYYNGSLDGIIGPDTKIAIMNFQKDYGLTVTGTLSDELLKYLQIK